VTDEEKKKRGRNEDAVSLAVLFGRGRAATAEVASLSRGANAQEGSRSRG
jgi:hypothetical protein